MAISTFKTFLMYKASASADYTKVVDIKSFPDLGENPNMIETTTLTDPMQTFIKGIIQLPSDGLTFTANYTNTDYTTVKELEDGKHSFAIWFGGTESNGVVTPTGSDGKFEFEGELAVYVNGGGGDEVVNMTIAIAPRSPITVGT